MFDFLVNVFLGFRLRGSDEPYRVNLVVPEVHEPRVQARASS